MKVKEFESNRYAKTLAVNKQQSDEIRRLQGEVNWTSSEYRRLADYCYKLEEENTRLRKHVARLEKLQSATSIWGY
jgi:hypothetical protein